MKYNIHCEMLYDDDVWYKLTRFLRKKGKKTHLFLMPPQPTYLKSNLGFRGTKEELVTKLTKRYKALVSTQYKYKYKLGLHLHLSINPHVLSETEKDASVKYVYNWVSKFLNESSSSLQKDINTIAFGWFKYDKYVARLCKENKIKIINDQWGAITFHDYDLPLTYQNVFEKWLRTALRKVKGQNPKR